jgi:hypothetical protein
MTSRAGSIRKVIRFVSVVIISLSGSLSLGYAGLAQAAMAAVPTAANCAPGADSTGAGAHKQADLVAQAPAGGCPAGLIAYWKLDETSGNSFADSVDSHAASCNSGCPISTTGVVSTALTFNSATTVTVPANSAFDFGVGDSFSVQAWVRMPVAGSCTPEPAIGRASPSVTLMQWWLGCDGGKAEFVVKDKDGVLAAPAGGPTLTDGTFHYLVGVRNAGDNTVKLYVDGALEDSVAVTYTNGFDSASPIDLGWYHAGSTYHFTGDLDEVAIYSRALSASDVSDYFAKEQGGHGLCDVVVGPPPAFSLYLPLVMR